MSIAILRGDARNIPLADGSVDVVCTSPPYQSLRDYQDGGSSLAGQIGAEATPREYVEALLDCTREWVRVLRPSGSMFVVLGDRYTNRSGTGWGRESVWDGRGRPETIRQSSPHRRPDSSRSIGLPEKSLLGMPWRYALACTDELGLVWRAEIVWEKGNGLPESARDRVVRGHEVILELGADDGEFDTMLHLTKQGRYYFATDLIREPHTRTWGGSPNGGHTYEAMKAPGEKDSNLPHALPNPLGALPRSVWRIPSAPLNVPERIEHARCCGGRKRRGCQDGLSHHAAYPPALARRVILGWSPTGICLECGDGRWPVAARHRIRSSGFDGIRGANDGSVIPMSGGPGFAGHAESVATIIGYACACTPYTDHKERRRPTVTPSRERRQDQEARAALGHSRHHGDDWPARLPARDYHFDDWTPPPTRPAVVLDPFAGTGTTLLVADVLGRHAVGVELSADYCGLATWRTTDPAERARAMQVPKPPVVHDDQLAMFEDAV